jgi:hypothetical protein
VSRALWKRIQAPSGAALARRSGGEWQLRMAQEISSLESRLKLKTNLMKPKPKSLIFPFSLEPSGCKLFQNRIFSKAKNRAELSV